MEAVQFLHCSLLRLHRKVCFREPSMVPFLSEGNLNRADLLVCVLSSSGEWGSSLMPIPRRACSVGLRLLCRVLECFRHSLQCTAKCQRFWPPWTSQQCVWWPRLEGFLCPSLWRWPAFPFQTAVVRHQSHWVHLYQWAPARASDACCHLRLIPFSVCAPGVPVPVSARSAEGQRLQSPSVTLSLSWMLVRCLENPLDISRLCHHSCGSGAFGRGCVLLFICLSAGRG